jgi:Periplasmic copper-binding protein (NosD).
LHACRSTLEDPLTIKNCVMQDYHEAIMFFYTSGANISHVKVLSTNYTNAYDGIYAEYSSGIEISNVELENIQHPIHSSGYGGVQVRNANITECIDCIYLGGDNNQISNVNINKCQIGVWFVSSNYNTLRDSIISDCITYGIRLSFSKNNLIYNNVLNNTNNIYFDPLYPNYWNTTLQPGTNIWNSSLGYIGGNLWTNPSNNGYSDNCTDANFDGFCDDPYYLTSDGSNIDYLPLAKYVGQTPPSAPSYTGVSSCMQITQPGEYRLVNDLQLGSYPYCLEILSNNVIIDCQGYRFKIIQIPILLVEYT